MTREQVLQLLEDMLAALKSDPPDGEYQEGYRAALIEVWRHYVAPPIAASEMLHEKRAIP